MRYLSAICVIFCFIGSGVTTAPIQCVNCDTIPADSVRRIVSQAAKEVFTEAIDSLNDRMAEVRIKHRILVLKTAMVERKLNKPAVMHVDSFRTLTGWWVVYWWGINGQFTHTTEIYDNNVRNRNSTNRPKVHRAN